MRRPDFSRRVAVTGLGVISPIGQDVDTVWNNLVAGRTGLHRITRWDPTPYEAQIAGEVQRLRPGRNGWTSRPRGGRTATCTSAWRRRSRPSRTPA